MTSNSLLLKPQLDSNSFHVAMRFSLRLAQFFSYFPIDVGVESGKIKFSWVYCRIIYSFITFCVFVLEFGLVVFHTFRPPLTLVKLNTLVFHLGGLTQYVLFFRLTKNWPDFVKEWQSLEFRMKRYEVCGNLRIRLNCMTAIIMTIAGIEHVLVNMYKVIKWISEESNADRAIQIFFVTTYQYFFEVFSYSIWFGLILQFTNLQRTFNWSYADVFVMLIGSAFTHKLRQMTQKIRTLSKPKVNHSNNWSTLRKDYVKLSEMCAIINDRISSVIIVCYLLNLYFVLVQLFSSLGTFSNLVEQVYFFISFGLLILRTTCVCMFGGSVYEEWRNVGFALNSVKSSSYNLEVERLTVHVETWELKLSGKNFFNITRSLVLKIASAIVTYELVLIQFYSFTLKDDR